LLPIGGASNQPYFAHCGSYGFVAYYNFVWRTRHSDGSGKAGRLRPTAAMMAKVVPDLWDFERLYNEVIQYG
jgi:hypothetical protein